MQSKQRTQTEAEANAPRTPRQPATPATPTRRAGALQLTPGAEPNQMGSAAETPQTAGGGGGVQVDQFAPSPISQEENASQSASTEDDGKFTLAGRRRLNQDDPRPAAFEKIEKMIQEVVQQLPRQENETLLDGDGCYVVYNWTPRDNSNAAIIDILNELNAHLVKCDPNNQAIDSIQVCQLQQAILTLLKGVYGDERGRSQSADQDADHGYNYGGSHTLDLIDRILSAGCKLGVIQIGFNDATENAPRDHGGGDHGGGGGGGGHDDDSSSHSSFYSTRPPRTDRYFDKQRDEGYYKQLSAIISMVTSTTDKMPKEDQHNKLVAELQKGKGKLTEEFISVWKKCMDMVCRADLLKPGQSVTNLVGNESLSVSMTPMFNFNERFEWLKDKNATTKGAAKTDGISTYFRRTTTIVKNTLSSSTIINAQAPSTADFNPVQEEAYDHAFARLMHDLEAVGFGVTEGTLPNVEDILDDTPKAVRTFEHYIAYHSKVQRRLVHFMADFLSKLVNKMPRAEFRHAKEMADTSVTNVANEKNAVTPKCVHWHPLDMIVMRDFEGLFLVQAFIYELATPDMSSITNAVSTYMQSSSKVNPAWSLREMLMHHTEKTAVLQRSSPVGAVELEQIYFLETMHLVACFEGMNYARWNEGGKVLQDLRAFTFERNRVGGRHELGLAYKSAYQLLNTHAETTFFPEDSQKKAAHDKKQKVKANPSVGGGGGNGNAPPSDGGFTPDVIERIESLIDHLKINDKKKTDSAMKIVTSKKKLKSTDKDAADSWALGELDKSSKLSAYVTEATKMRKKFPLGDGLSIPKSAVASASTNEYAALLYLNPSVTNPPSKKGKKVVAQPSAVNDAAEEEEEPEVQVPAEDERDKTIAELTAKLEKFEGSMAEKDEANAKVTQSLFEKLEEISQKM